MRLEGANFEEVDEEVLTCRPAVTSRSMQADRNSNCVVGECFDVTLGDVTAVTGEEKTETNDDRGQVNSGSGEDVMPAQETSVNLWREK